ncbi:tyrosine-type recombinase/integrase [Bacillus sp. 31A1R]|uniref:Tyrosine-type recombinase/integrase n=1 Tax=Robertmurraya mangrovi TaxID=3098077 RepID=A0ABU5J516_9BACI|nr:tyrosine-type recombinase/integrase [Bacillus sp. 31A1R]MDZ5474482.1 tyrosine-type recombinase/integrase [Bacillus sp. 31A1R]
MEHVDAIYDKQSIQAMKQLLKKSSKRDYLLFVFGINTGLKISEILTIKIEDILNKDHKINAFYELHSEAKGTTFIYLNKNVQKAITSYLESTEYKMDDFLFKSSKTDKAITRQQAYRIISKAAETVGVVGNIGTQSMRKTFGYHAYKRGVAISLLQKLFNHASPSETLKYLGIDKKDKIKTEIDVDL